MNNYLIERKSECGWEPLGIGTVRDALHIQNRDSVIRATPIGARASERKEV